MGAEIKVKASFDGSEVKRGLDSLRGKASEFAGSLATRYLGFAAAAAGVVKGYSMMREAAKKFGDVADRAARFGVSTSDLQKIEFAANEVGITSEKAGGLLDKLRLAMSRAGRDTKLAETMKAVGVTAEVIAQNDPGRAFEQMANGLKDLTTPQRVAALREIFGNRAAVDAMTLFQDLDGLKRNMADAPILSDIEVAKLQRMDEILERMERRWNNIKAGVVGSFGGTFGTDELNENEQARLDEQFRRGEEAGFTGVTRALSPRGEALLTYGDFYGRTFGRRLFPTAEARLQRTGVSGAFANASPEAIEFFRKVQSEQFLAAMKKSGISAESVLGMAEKTPEQLAEQINRLKGLSGLGGVVKGIELITPESIAEAARQATKARADAAAAGGTTPGTTLPTASTSGIVAQAIQTVGGGGFAFAPDVTLSTLTRIADATEETAERLRAGGAEGSGVEPGDY
jgi:hypothetical protein